MFQKLKKIFGLGSKVNYKELLQEGAQIIDVRTTGEFQSGDIKGSVNIPLQNLPNGISKINKDKPVIVCCASGMRSTSAKNILKTNGFTQVHNGGSWLSLQNIIWH